MLQTEAVVIGAGLIGLAIAKTLAEQGREVIVLEANGRFGEETSSRNSEVIHAGLYYPAESLKARLCIAGRRALYDYCAQHRVPHQKLGKWLIATNADQAERLAGVRDQAAANGVELEWASRQAIHDNLPGTRVTEALYSSETGIVDSHQLMLAFVKQLEASGGNIAYHTRATRITTEGGQHQVHAEDDTDHYRLAAPIVINAAGLGANALACQCEALSPEQVPPLYYAKGNYFDYGARHPFKSLVYPVPEEGGLGIHLTLDLAGGARFGPNVEWTTEPDYRVDATLRDAFHGAITNWWPAARCEALQPGYAGIRPKLKGRGEGFFDFQIQGPEQHGHPGLVHLFGIESPGLTASLAIAQQTTNQLAQLPGTANSSTL